MPYEWQCELAIFELYGDPGASRHAVVVLPWQFRMGSLSVLLSSCTEAMATETAGVDYLVSHEPVG